MSDLLRDDVQETAVTAERWFYGMHALTQEKGRGRDDVLFGVFAQVHETARMHGEAVNGDLFVLYDVARGRDGVLHQVVSGCLNREKAKIKERYFSPYVAIVFDVGHGYGSAIDGSNARNDVVHERIRIREKWVAARVFDDVVHDSAKIRDTAFLGSLNVVGEVARMRDVVFSGSLKYEKIHDVARGSASVVLAQDNRQFVVSSAKMRDVVFAKAEQGAFWYDLVAVWDEVLTNETLNGAIIWTANTDSWAVSQYLPTDVVALAVVDGVVWGLAKNAVYALDGNDEIISGSLKMGLVDVSGGGLLHPVGSYVEYQRDDGAVADLAVTMPQSGQNQRFVYRLARERADSLTNGRFVLGRGLRGRHFGFELMLQGKWAFVHDWSLDLVPTKRRV